MPLTSGLVSLPSLTLVDDGRHRLNSTIGITPDPRQSNRLFWGPHHNTDHVARIGKHDRYSGLRIASMSTRVALARNLLVCIVDMNLMLR